MGEREADTGQRRRIEDRSRLAKISHSPTLPIGTLVTMVLVAVGVIASYVKLEAQSANTVEAVTEIKEDVSVLKNTYISLTIRAERLIKDVERIDGLQREVRDKLSDPSVLRPDAWTATEDRRAMDALKHEVRRMINGVQQ